LFIDFAFIFALFGFRIFAFDRILASMSQTSPPIPDSWKTGPRRGAVAVIWRGEELLVIRRALHIRAGGMMCFPGGGIEAGETEEEALMRELREELNATVIPVRRVWQSTTRWGVELNWWLAELPDHSTLAANPDEVHSIHWHTPPVMTRLSNLLESNREFLALAARGEIVIR
jgi:8-oxo-dGTP diphosphatase